MSSTAASTKLSRGGLSQATNRSRIRSVRSTIDSGFSIHTGGGPADDHEGTREKARWQGLIEDYLERRETLRAAVLLQDLRRDLEGGK